MSTPEICLKERSPRKSWSKCTCRLLTGPLMLTSVSQYTRWEEHRSSSSSTPKDPCGTTRGPICHHPLLHLAAARQWILVLQTHAPDLVERGYNATTAKGLAISHVSAHSHASPSNNSRPSLHSNKEAILMMKESTLCVGCPLQKCRTFSKISKTRE